MKKSTKLLSVILAVVMLFTSMSVMASAAKTSYQTTSDLESLQAYSPYGAVTRLSTEERLSILCDYLDIVLADANINMGKQDLSVLGSLTLDLTSINSILNLIDEAKGVLGHWLLSGLKWMLGDLGDANLKNWPEDMTRENTAHATIVSSLLQILNDNAGLVHNVIERGSLDLGSIVGGLVDLSAVNVYLSDIPGLIKGLITPMLERKDDTVAEAETLAAASSMDSILTSFVQGLFTKPQSTTTVKADSTGAITSDHDLPTAEDGLRYYYVAGTSAGTPSYTCYVYDPANDVYKAEEEAFVLTEEVEGSGVYVFKKASGDTLKYYEPESYWLPSLVESGSAADIMNISTQTGVQMLYNMIPYVFGEMAPVVLNGSVKKAIGEWFGASYNYVGEVGSEEVAALGDDVFFTQPQGDYLWEWSDYKVIDGVHYYRFEDSIYQADLTNINAYFNIIDWNYQITADLLNDYIPGTDGNTASAAGYNTILQGVNDFLGEVAGLVLSDDVVAGINWTAGDNSKLLDNIKKAARYIVAIAPEAIFGANYAEDEYYNLMMDESATDQEILCGIAAKLLEFLMPQLILPSASGLEGQSLGAMFAIVLRELATQFVPTYNYDALIYADYNTKTLLSGKDNSYWLDVCLTIGVDIGMSYLRNLADLGEDTDVGYDFADSKIYELAAFEQNPQAWEASVDWIIDWALSNDYEWTWKMENLVDCGDTIDLATAQDPWVKLGNILKNLLPIDQILNVDTSNANWLETTLRDNFVMALLDLDLGKIAGDANTTGLLDIPNSSILFTTPLLTTVVTVVRDLLNDLLYKVAGNYTFFDAGIYTSIDSVLNQGNLADLIQALLQRLPTANTNGILDTALPILNFFVGWTTDAQKYADPSIQFNNPNGYDYIYATGGNATTTLKVTNNSGGMLLKHRSNGSYDNSYVLVIDGIDGDFTTSQSFPLEVAPYTTASFDVTMPYSGVQGVSINVYYHYKLKDGGETPARGQMVTSYQMVSDAAVDANFNKSYSDGYEQSSWFTKIRLEGSASPVNPLVTTQGALASTLAGVTVTWTNSGESDYSGTLRNSSFSGYDSTYITDSGETASIVGTSLAKGSSATIAPMRLSSSVDPETIPSGTVIDIGQAYTELYQSGSRNARLTADLGNLYYLDMTDVQTLFNDELDLARKAADYTEATWAVYVQGMKDAATVVLQPFQSANFASYTDEYFEAAYNALLAAVEQLKEAENASETVTPESVLQPVLDTAEPEGQEINYQDYELYEYWDYEEQRTAARDLIAATTAPEAPDAYIDGSALSEAEIDAIIAAEDNATLKSAIESTVLEPSEEELADYAQTLADWVPAAYTELELYDMASKLPYYKQFLLAKTTEKQFLAKELAYAAAQNYVETAWSTDSWNAYQAALATANEVNGDPSAKQSTVFDAKYNLMLTQNNLVPADESAKDNGVYDSLNSLIATADSIFADTEGAWTVKEGVQPADAYKQLVEALGYEYEDADGYTQNLYWDSAKAFVATDRVIGEATTNATNAMADKLQAAIDNFVSTAAEPELQPSENGTAAGTIIDRTSYCANGAGFIYGIDVYDLYGDAEILDKLTTPSGSIRVTANDMGVYSTGAKIELLSASGDVVETYYYIYFGDINGDGVVDFSDVTTVEGINSFMDFDFAAGDGSVAGMAADINGDEVIDFTDVTYVEGVNSYIDFPMQSETAATVAANKGISQ